MRVTIDANGRKVEVECADANTTAREVLAEALSTWKETDGVKPSEGPAFGIVAATHAGYQQSPMNMGGYGGADVRPVKA
jgi:hypothetical protein